MPQYLRIDGVTGEATDSGYEDWIELDGFSLQVAQSQARNGDTRSGQGGKPVFSFLNVTKELDGASPTLTKLAASGKSVGTIVVELTQTADGATRYQRYEFGDAVVASVTTEGNGGPRPRESVSFAYSTMKTNYEGRKLDGSSGKNAQAGWDLARNVEI